MGLSYSFKGIFHYQDGEKHCGVQVDMVLEKSWEFYIFICRQQKRTVGLTKCSLSIYNPKLHLHSDNLLEQGHIYSH